LAKSYRNPAEGYQFLEVLKMLARGEISDDVVRGCIYLYQIESKIVNLPIKDLTNGKYSKTSLNDLKLASSHKNFFDFPFQKPELLEKMVANQILYWENEDPKNLIYDKNKKKIYISR
jgi:hypothetical protein